MMDKKIYITSSGLIIHPYRKHQSKHLEYKTSMKDFGCKFRRIETTGFIIDDFFVTHHQQKFVLENEFPDYQIEEIRPLQFKKFPDDIDFEMNGDMDLNEIQYEVVKKVLSDQRNARWFIHCPQGFGKTVMTIFMMTRIRINTIIMCYSNEILKQWVDKIEKFTDLQMSRVLVLDKGSLITDILNDNLSSENFNIIISTPIMLISYAKKHGWDTIQKFFQKCGIGLKVYDEAHRQLGNMTKIDALTSVKYTLYLSGDFAQSGNYKTKLFYAMFQDVKVIKPTAEQLNDLRYTDAIICEFNSNPSPMDTLSIISKRGISIWDYMEYELKKGVLIRVIDWILDHIIALKEENRRILILTNKIAHCEYFYEHIRDKYPSKEVGCFHGKKSAENNEYVKDNAQIIIATYQSFSTGVDTENIKYVISTSMSNRVEDSQASGRARPLGNGENCMFWLLVDTGFERSFTKEKERIDYLYKLKIREVTRITYTE